MADAEKTKAKAKDENDRLLDGTLPTDPGADAVPIPIDSEIRKLAVSLASPDGKSISSPSDIDAEIALLAAMLWCGTYAQGTQTPGTVADLLERSEPFASAAHRVIWAAMLALRARSVPCDATAVHSELVRTQRERLAGGMDYLEKLVAAASPSNDIKLREYASAIREAWMKRRLMATAKALYAAASEGKELATEIASSYASKLSEAAGLGVQDASYVHVSVPLAKTLDRAQRPGMDSAITTGIPEVDRLLIGGLRRREVSLLAARTSVGKSALALEMALCAHEANRTEVGVVYISLEMPEESFTIRMVAARAKVETRKILQGRCSDEELLRIRDVVRGLRDDDLFFNVHQNLTVSAIRGILTRVSRDVVKRGRRIGLVVIDHIGLVKPSSRHRSREQEVAELSRDLRNIANDYDCHVIALTQISREAEKQTGKDKMPKLHHLRESGALEQDADNVLILHRDRDKAGRGFVTDRPARLAVAKARNAELGLVWLAVDPKFVRFSPWHDSDDSLARAPTDDGQPYERLTHEQGGFTKDPEPPEGFFDDL